MICPSSSYLHWRLYADTPASTAQCCPFFQNQPVAECSYTAGTLPDQISGSRLPWPLLHSLSFLPSSCFLCDSTKHLCLVVHLQVHRYPVRHLIYLYMWVRPCHYVCVRALGYSWASWAEIAILFFFGPLLLPDSICSVHAPRPEALIPSDQGASTNTALTNGLLAWLSGLPPTSQRPSISPKSFYRAFNTQTKGQVCLRQPRSEV